MTKKDLPTIQLVMLINKKNFARVVLKENVEVFVVYIPSFTLKMIIHLVQKAQITLLFIEGVIVLTEIFEFDDVFSIKLAKVLLKCT